MAGKLEILTATGGKAAADGRNSITAGPRGPLVMLDDDLLEKLA
jgi:catalase